MIVATYSLHNEAPRILATVTGQHHWLIKLRITGREEGGHDDVKVERDIKTGRCSLSDALPTAHEEIAEMLSGMEYLTSGGFQVIRLR